MSFIKQHKNKLYIIAIFLFALFIRIYRLGSLPFGFHQDEIMNGYVGRFILLNGKDLYGNRWPLIYFDRFGDYPNVIPMYISGLSTFIFGVNEFAVRFPIALIASLAIFPVYILTKWIFKDKKIALMTAFFLALTPWHVVLSRATSECIIGSTVFITAMVLIIKSIKTNNKLLLFLSFLLYGLTYFLYPSFRIIVPASLLPIPLLFKPKDKTIKLMLIGIIIFFFVLTIYISQTPWGKGRFDQTSIFNYQGLSIQQKLYLYNTNHPNVFITRLFHNKFITYSKEFLNQYLSYFSPVFLFIQGGLPIRYAIPEQGLFYLTLLIMGFIVLIPFARKVKTNINNFLLLYIIYLILIVPIPSALTINDSPNIHRTALMSILLIFIFTYFFYLIKDIYLKKFNLKYALILFMFIEFIFFWHQYSQHADNYQNLGRNDGFREVIKYVLENKNKYKQIYLPVQGTFPLYYLFYKNDFNYSYAGRFQTDIRINKIDNINFMDEKCPFKLLQDKDIVKNSFAVGYFDCVEEYGFKYIKTIYGTNNTVGFKVFVP